MKRYIISTGTVTYAIKGRDILRRKGYKAGIERISGTKNSGCGYSIILNGDLPSAEKILRENGVKILDITEQK